MFKRSIALTAAVVALSVSLAAADEIKLVGGSTSIVTVITPVKAAFEKATGITLNATAAGSKVAVQKLDAGDVEAATAAHTPEELFGVLDKDKIQLKNRDKLKVAQLAPPASFAIIVNPANPVAKFSKEQINDIFSGKITNWKDVGGKDAPILCVVSNLSPGSNELFSKTFLGGKKIGVETLEASTGADLRQNVASSPEAIGYLAGALVDGSVKAVEGPVIKSNPIILLTVGAPSPKVQKLIDFILGEGKSLIK